MVVIAPNIYAVTAWAGCLPKFATARPALAAVACWLVAVSCAKLKVLIRCYENIEYSNSVANSVYQLVTPTSPARKKKQQISMHLTTRMQKPSVHSYPTDTEGLYVPVLPHGLYCIWCRLYRILQPFHQFSTLSWVTQIRGQCSCTNEIIFNVIPKFVLLSRIVVFTPFTTKIDQCQISPAASQETLHCTV